MNPCDVNNGVTYPDGAQLNAAFYFSVNGTVSGFSATPDIHLGVNFGSGGQNIPLPAGANQVVHNDPKLFPFLNGEAYTYYLETSFVITANCAASSVCSADYLDPDLIGIVITDPTTGSVVSGITATASDGTILPTDTGTPEPSSIILGGLGLMGICLGLFRDQVIHSRPPAAVKDSGR